MNNVQPKHTNDNSSSAPSTSRAVKRKDYNRRYYANKENKKSANVSVSQRAPLISLSSNQLCERTHLGSLHPNSSHTEQVTNDVPSCTSVEQRSEANRRYRASRIDKGKRISSDAEVSQAMIGDQQPVGVVTLEEDPYDFVFVGIPTESLILKDRNPCSFCFAKLFKYEFPTFCCMNSLTVLANLEIPDELYRLFTLQNETGIMFRSNIRAYNTNFSFASMGVTLDESLSNMRDGVYTFRAHKGIYHRIDQLVSRDGTPRYLQLYFYDPETELEHRLRWPNLDRNITETLSRVLSTNPYVLTFRSLAELGPLDNYKVTLNASAELDQRVYNRPTTSEVYD